MWRPERSSTWTPIPSLHPGAPKALEAALCAGEQGAYWGMHDLLFENPRQVTTEDLEAQAGRLGVYRANLGLLDGERCVVNGHSPAVILVTLAIFRGNWLRFVILNSSANKRGFE